MLVVTSSIPLRIFRVSPLSPPSLGGHWKSSRGGLGWVSEDDRGGCASEEVEGEGAVAAISLGNKVEGDGAGSRAAL